MGRLFGTDGVRGIANQELTPLLAFYLGRAAAAVLGKGQKGVAILGRDTRLSGSMLAAALTAGVTSPAVTFWMPVLSLRLGLLI